MDSFISALVCSDDSGKGRKFALLHPREGAAPLEIFLHSTPIPLCRDCGSLGVAEVLDLACAGPWSPLTFASVAIHDFWPGGIHGGGDCLRLEQLVHRWDLCIADVDQYLGYFTEAATLSTLRRWCCSRRPTHFQVERQNTGTTIAQSRLEVALREALQVQVALYRHQPLLGHAAILPPAWTTAANEISFKTQLQTTVAAQRLFQWLCQDLRCCCRAGRGVRAMYNASSETQAAPIARIWLSWSASAMKHTWRFNDSTSTLCPNLLNFTSNACNPVSAAALLKARSVDLARLCPPRIDERFHCRRIAACDERQYGFLDVFVTPKFHLVVLLAEATDSRARARTSGPTFPLPVSDANLRRTSSADSSRNWWWWRVEFVRVAFRSLVRQRMLPESGGKSIRSSRLATPSSNGWFPWIWEIQAPPSGISQTLHPRRRLSREMRWWTSPPLVVSEHHANDAAAQGSSSLPSCQAPRIDAEVYGIQQLDSDSKWWIADTLMQERTRWRTSCATLSPRRQRVLYQWWHCCCFRWKVRHEDPSVRVKERWLHEPCDAPMRSSNTLSTLTHDTYSSDGRSKGGLMKKSMASTSKNFLRSLHTRTWASLSKSGRPTADVKITIAYSEPPLRWNCGRAKQKRRSGCDGNLISLVGEDPKGRLKKSDSTSPWIGNTRSPSTCRDNWALVHQVTQPSQLQRIPHIAVLSRRTQCAGCGPWQTSRPRPQSGALAHHWFWV